MPDTTALARTARTLGLADTRRHIFLCCGADTMKCCAGDTALASAFQVKPRISRRFARNWSWFAEYRYLATSDIFGEFFNDDARSLRLHGLGLGVTRRF